MDQHQRKFFIVEAILPILLLLFIFFVLFIDLSAQNDYISKLESQDLEIQRSLGEMNQLNKDLEARISILEIKIANLQADLEAMQEGPEEIVEEDPVPPLTGKDLYISYAFEIGEQYHVSPYLLMSIIEHESHYNPNATSSSGCQGLMQVSPYWHGARAKRLGVDDLYDPYGNILTGTDYLVELLEDYAGEDITYALMLYNMNWDRAKELYSQGIVSNYAKSVLSRAEELEVELNAERKTG